MTLQSATIDPFAVYTRRHDGGVRRMRREVGGVTRRQSKRGSVCGIAAVNKPPVSAPAGSCGLAAHDTCDAGRTTQRRGAARDAAGGQ